MLAAAGSATGPAARSRCSVSIGRASGMSGQSSRAGPMSTRTRPSGSASEGRLPATVRITWLRRPVSRASRSTTQRVALPQAPASAPSGLRMRMKASALEFGGGGSMAMNWSQPTPVRRSAIAAARRPVRPSEPARSSNTTKSLPQPCILRKRAMGRVYAAAGWGEGADQGDPISGEIVPIGL